VPAEARAGSERSGRRGVTPVADWFCAACDEMELPRAAPVT